VGDNDLGINKERTNTFNFHGQAGVGVDVAFLFLEAGFNYGFSDLLKNDVQSNPAQVFINLGFRF
jgi:outer membrane protein W